MHPEVVQAVIDDIGEAGGSVVRDEATDLLRINGEFSASVVIVRCRQTSAGAQRWKLRLDQGLRPSITIAVRMAENNVQVRDYYILPWLDPGLCSELRLASHNGVQLDSYRVDTLDPFLCLVRRRELRAA